MKSFLLKSFFLLVCATLTLSNQLWAEEANLSLVQAIALVQQNRALLAQKQGAEALSFKAKQSSSLPNPVLSLGLLNLPSDSFALNQEDMTQFQLGLSQAIPFPGKRDLRASSDYDLAKAEAEGVHEFSLRLVSQVKRSWWRLFYVDHALEAVLHNQQLMRQLIRIAESKYKVGKGLQQDVLLAQLELSKLLDMRLQLDAVRKQEVATLNTLLNRPVNQLITLPLLGKENLPALFTEAELVALALVSRPSLAKQKYMINAAQSRVSLAEKENYPDFKLGVSYGFRAKNPTTNINRADLASVTLSMSLPFFTGDKQDGQQQQRQAELMREDFQYQDIRNKVMLEISQAFSAYEQAKSQAALFRSGIIPQAKQTVASMLAAYQVNKVDFLNLVRVQVTLYNYETQYWQAITQANQALARLKAAVGKDVTHE